MEHGTCPGSCLASALQRSVLDRLHLTCLSNVGHTWRQVREDAEVIPPHLVERAGLDALGHVLVAHPRSAPVVGLDLLRGVGRVEEGDAEVARAGEAVNGLGGALGLLATRRLAVVVTRVAAGGKSFIRAAQWLRERQRVVQS